MLGHRLRRWPNIGTALGECFVFAGMTHSACDPDYVHTVRTERHAPQCAAYWRRVHTTYSPHHLPPSEPLTLDTHLTDFELKSNILAGNFFWVDTPPLSLDRQIIGRVCFQQCTYVAYIQTGRIWHIYWYKPIACIFLHVICSVYSI